MKHDTTQIRAYDLWALLNATISIGEACMPVADSFLAFSLSCGLLFFLVDNLTADIKASSRREKAHSDVWSLSFSDVRRFTTICCQICTLWLPVYVLVSSSNPRVVCIVPCSVQREIHLSFTSYTLICNLIRSIQP